MRKIILASASPRRKLLLQQIGLDFQCLPADIPESYSAASDAAEVVKQLAWHKARAVCPRVHDAIIIAADTLVVRENYIMGKPKDSDEAYRQLSLLSGKCHQVITGLCVMDTKSAKIDLAEETTRVFFRSLSEMEIRHYIASGECYDKAGSYGIQGLGALLVERIEGCYYNVVGLPLNRLALMLKRQGVDLLRG